MDQDQHAGVDPVARARALADQIAAAGDEIERIRRIPEPLLGDLHAARLFRMVLPRAYDGDEVSPMAYLQALEEIARHDASVAWNIFVGNAAALIAPYLEPETARLIYGDPRALIAWGPPVGPYATAEPGGYRITAQWGFASGCRHATWMGAHCYITETDGSTRTNDAGRSVMLTLLFPADQATLLDDWHTIGLCGTGSESYSVTDLFVPDAFIGQRGDPTVRRIPGPLYAITQQSLYAASVGAVALGIAGAMLSELCALALRKTPLGRPRMADDTRVQAGIARAEAKLGAARAYLTETLADIYAHADDTAPIDIPDRARIRLASSHAIHASLEVADFTHKAAGVDAIFHGRPLERRFRDIHTLSQQVQSHDAHYESIGQILLGNLPEVFF